jgi:hypothetical protein
LSLRITRASAPRGQAKAILLRIIALQLRLAWDDVVHQELPPPIQRLVQQLERSQAN